MPVPKQRHSKSRTRRRRSHNAVKPKQLVSCSNCGKPKLNHAICSYCGYYKKEEVINFFEKSALGKKKK